MNEPACLLTDPGRIGLNGGSKCGTFWLDDSNIDWGGGLIQFKQWMDQNARGRVVHLDYPWGFPPAAYGITALSEDIPFQTPPEPGLHAVTATKVARYPAGAGGSDCLRSPVPPARKGNCIYIYELPPRR